MKLYQAKNNPYWSKEIRFIFAFGNDATDGLWNTIIEVNDES